MIWVLHQLVYRVQGRGVCVDGAGLDELPGGGVELDPGGRGAPSLPSQPGTQVAQQ